MASTQRQAIGWNTAPASVRMPRFGIAVLAAVTAVAVAVGIAAAAAADIAGMCSRRLEIADRLPELTDGIAAAAVAVAIAVEQCE